MSLHTETTREPPKAHKGAEAGVIIDESVIAELREAVGPEVVQELVETFNQDAPQQVQAIEAASTSDALMRSAHRLKGGSLSLGLRELADLCLRLEHAGRHGKLDDARAEVLKVAPALRRALEALACL